MTTKPPESDAQSLRERVLAGVAKTLESYLNFHDQVTEKSAEGWPTFSQSIRIKALLDNKRILVADDTGVNGKTFTAIMSKVSLDRTTGRRNPTLIVAPNAGMLNAWSADEVNRYVGYVHAPRQEVVTIESYEDLARISATTDFAVINWEKLSVQEDDKRQKLIDSALGRLKPELFVFDEVHNAKGSTSLRAQTVRRMIDRTKDKYVMLLSATPIPNRYRDLGMIFHMLDPAKYQSPNMFTYCPPDVMKELLDRQVWFRLTRHDLKEELGLPEFKEVKVPVVLTDKEAEIYFKAWSDCVSLGEGLTELRKALYDPRLSKYAGGLEGLVSSKMRAVDTLTGKLIANGEKVVIKTNYVEGVIGTIAEHVQKHGNVLVVSGNTPLAERKRLYMLFKNSPSHNILVTSPVTEESVDLTTNDTPCSMIAMEPEMTPREFTQFSGRVYRRGQKGDVKHHTLITESPVLNKLMVDYLKQLAEEHDIKIPKNFRPRTLDEDMRAMRQAKEEIVEKVYGGERLTGREIAVYDADVVDRAVTHLEGLVKPSVFKTMSPFALSTVVQGRWKNLGEKQFDRLVHSKGWRKWCSWYEEGWENSASQATNALIGDMIYGLDDLVQGSVIVSVGDGAAYFSRATNIPSLGIDLDERFLKRGKQICDKAGIQYSYQQGKATETGLASKSTYVVINSYMIFYLGQDGKRHEIEECVLETNRILKKGGHFILSLPYTVEERKVKEFSANLEKYGFSEEEHHLPADMELPTMKSGCYILRYRKVQDVKKAQGLDLALYSTQRLLV